MFIENTHTKKLNETHVVSVSIFNRFGRRDDRIKIEWELQVIIVQIKKTWNKVKLHPVFIF